MDLSIEIESESVTEKQIQTGSSEFTVHEQVGWLRTPGDRYPQKCTLQLADGQSPHRKGEYHINPTSVIINRFGNVQLKKILDLVSKNKGRDEAA